MPKPILITLALLISLAGGAWAVLKFPAHKIIPEQSEVVAVTNAEKYQFFYNKAEEGIKQEDERRTDFWLARYFGLAVNNDETDLIFSNLSPLFGGYKVSKPTTLISGHYDTDFLNWFIYSTYEMWDFNEKENGLEMDDNITLQLSGAQDDYYVAVVFGGHPWLEGRQMVGGDRGENTVAILVLSDPAEKIYLSVTESSNKKTYSKIELETTGLSLQHIWEPEFFDVDGDQKPEIFVRYNLATADGFTQVLAIYKVKNNEVVLLKKFEGKSEGLARISEDGVIEVGEGLGANGESHLSFSKFKLTAWEFKNGDFRKKSEKIIPHILLNSSWTDYYE